MLRKLLKTQSKSVEEPEIKELIILMTHTAPQALPQAALPNSSKAPA